MPCVNSVDPGGLCGMAFLTAWDTGEHCNTQRLVALTAESLRKFAPIGGSVTARRFRRLTQKRQPDVIIRVLLSPYTRPGWRCGINHRIQPAVCRNGDQCSKRGKRKRKRKRKRKGKRKGKRKRKRKRKRKGKRKRIKTAAPEADRALNAKGPAWWPRPRRNPSFHRNCR